MKYRLNAQQQAEVQLTINGVAFTATCTEAQLNDLFGEADCFDSEEDYEDYITDGGATEDWSIEVTGYPDMTDTVEDYEEYITDSSVSEDWSIEVTGYPDMTDTGDGEQN